MPSLLNVLLDAGRSAVELSLFVILPIMVVMMAVMRLLDGIGVLGFVARVLTPLMRPFGVPGIGVFAALQVLLVSYVAPRSTLEIMEERESTRGLAATLAMILAMSQANAVFPLVAVGLSLGLVIFTSLVGGLAAAAATYYLFFRSRNEVPDPPEGEPKGERSTGPVALLLEGGQEGVRLSLQAIPTLVFGLFLLGVVAALGVIPLLERGLSPVLEIVGLPGVAVLPVATKYIAGGTAMMGVVVDLIESGALTAADLDRLAGLMINPLDFVGVLVLCPAGTRSAQVKWAAIQGALVGILLRGVIHLVWV